MRNMTLQELGTVLDWAAGEGWNPGVEDAAAFFAADPGGFFVAEEKCRPVAAISVVNHSAEFAFLGLYICRPAQRGRGIGYALWQHALAHAGKRTIGLDGVAEQQGNYARSGFRHAGATTRYSGRFGKIASADAPGLSLRPAAAGDVASLVSVEAEVSGWRKARYLEAWFQNSKQRKSYIAERAGRFVGMMTVRTCRSGAKIGPLYAADETAAAALLRRAALRHSPSLTIDIPAGSERLASLCADLGLKPGFVTARMYRGAPADKRKGYFAVTTLELG